MRFRFYLFMLFMGVSVHSFEQKPVIDTGALGKWPKVDEVGISNNGHYFYYVLDERRQGRTILTVYSDFKGQDSVTIFGTRDGFAFTWDSRWGVFMKRGDSLGIVNLMRWTTSYIPGVSSYKVSQSRQAPCLAFLTKGTDNELILQNLAESKEMRFMGVSSYLFNRQGTSMAITRKYGKAGQEESEVVLVDVE